jgi:hypothetical protein
VGSPEATLAALDASAVRWCLLRDESEPGGDLDLLVHRADLGALRALLGGMGLVELRAWGRWPHHFFVAPALKLDVVTHLAFGPHATLRSDAAEALLAGRVANRPAPADEFWALLLHALLDRGAVRPHRARELEALAPCARDAESPLRPYVEAACPAGWDAAGVAEAAAAGRFEELLSLGPELRARWPGRRPMASAARPWLRGGLRLASRRLPSRPRLPAQQSGAITSNKAARSTG